MLLFFILASVLVLLALAMLLGGLVAAPTPEPEQPADDESLSQRDLANTRIAREQLAALDAALAAGSIDETQYREERAALERELAAQLDDPQAGLGGRKRRTRDGRMVAAALIIVALPLSAGILYQLIGTPDAIDISPSTDQTSRGKVDTVNGDPEAIAAADAKAAAAGLPPMDELVPNLKARLAEAPEDIEGRRLLARAQMTIGDLDGAAETLNEILALDENDVPAIIALADIIGRRQHGNLVGEPTTLLERALTIAPNDPQTLWLLGIAHQQAEQHDVALKHFDTLAEQMAHDEAAMATLTEVANQSRLALGLETLPVRPADSDAVGTDPTTPAGQMQTQTQTEPSSQDESTAISSGSMDASPSGPAVTVRASLSEEAAADAEPGHTVFIYARAAEGPPMPLAVSRHAVSDLPVEVTLDANMAMMPNMTLDSFPEVVVGARVSLSGNATPASGDWFAESAVIDATEQPTVDLVINEQRP